ncbi:hypothetical protein DACRYDRAFT_19590 [Dacryopinax primogenitus]|uniref:Putative phospholipase n=1 Tax=Dacryopinax primogenitus (strain DJM 731) TaxID=1858805 RepID=M5GCU1_DACPD|nr:uncharacterized protein DACRYDRAFT_19590 [Dacryopinax primogenitus]EJU06425.1 hypothetical protein DACRYDRAFT_19590 [Dacryopinax primogenitus]
MSLPRYKGPYDVGLTTLVLPVHPTASYGKCRVRGDEALRLEEVAFNVFYPARPANRRKRGVHWLVRPFSLTVEGYSKFVGFSTWILAPLFFLLGAFAKMPVFANAPLRQEEPFEESQEKRLPDFTIDEKKQWPLVLFSHGLAGGRTTYSTFCGRLASSGYVVLALEHRDGTGPMVYPKDKNGAVYAKPYSRVDEVECPDVDAKDLALHFRRTQLDFRKREVYEAYRAFRALVAGDSAHGGLQSIDGSPVDWDMFVGTVCAEEDVVLSGHSFGGATAFHIMSSPPPEGFNNIPISRSLVLDPWLDPLPSPGPNPRTDVPRPNLCVVLSERFTLWKAHFARTSEVVSNWRNEKGTESWLMTISRCRHDSFSDFPLIIPYSHPRGRLLHNVIQRISLAFLTDRLELEFRKDERYPLHVIQPRIRKKRGKARLSAPKGRVVWHD